ncbi:hypothetical protein FRB97_001541, partial [Tulasnella sp. 331]
MNKDTTDDGSNQRQSSKASKKPPTQSERNAVLDFLNQFPSEAATISPLQNSHPIGSVNEARDGTTETSEDSVEEDLGDLEELLRQLDEANSVAGGIEGRLDEILMDLETQLVQLEGKAESTAVRPGSS